jgi:serine/threonine protein kinase
VAVADHIAAALGVAHDPGARARDAKPSNVLFSDDRRVKVSDSTWLGLLLVRPP